MFSSVHCFSYYFIFSNSFQENRPIVTRYIQQKFYCHLSGQNAIYNQVIKSKAGLTGSSHFSQIKLDLSLVLNAFPDSSPRPDKDDDSPDGAG